MLPSYKVKINPVNYSNNCIKLKPQKKISSNLFFLIVLISVHNPDSEKISFGDGMSYKFNEGDMLIINKCDEYYFQKYTKVEYVQIYIDLCY